jgi:hypothetical protein
VIHCSWKYPPILVKGDQQAGGVNHSIWIGRNLVEGKKNIIKSVIFFHNQDFITEIVCCFDNNLKPLNASVHLLAIKKERKRHILLQFSI